MSAVLPCLTIVTARGGSKGLAGKNVRPLAGLPLLVHSLRCAALVPRLERVIVSTDSPEIAEVARRHGGDVPFLRPPELARDDTPSLPVLTHALAEMERMDGRRYASVLLLEPTSPARLPQDIEGALDRLEAAPDATMVLGCSEPTFNPFWVGVVEKNGRLDMVFPEMDKFKRRPTWLAIAGAWLVVLHYVDVYWLVMPVLHPAPALHWLDLAAPCAVLGLATAAAAARRRTRIAIASDHPRLAAAITYEGT